MHNAESSIAMIVIGGMLTVGTIIMGLLPSILPGEDLPNFGGTFFAMGKYVGMLLVAYGLFSLYNVYAHPEDDEDDSEAVEPMSSFSSVLQVSSATIRRYLERPGIAKDHPLRALPNVLSDLSLLEDGIPAKQRSLVTLTATKIAESVDDDKSWNTEGPRPELSSNVVEKLAALRDDLRREDQEQVNQTLSVLSTQLSRL